MEEWLHFVAVFSDFIFLPDKAVDILPGDTAFAWACLQKACRHYHLWDPQQLRNEVEWRRGSKRASRALRDYAKLAQSTFPMLCKFNLHMLVCRLPEQEESWGHTAQHTELSVEHEVGQLEWNTMHHL